MLPSGDVLPIARKPRDLASRIEAPGSGSDSAAAATKGFGGARRVRRAHSVVEGLAGGATRRSSSAGRSDLDSPSPSVTSLGRSPSVLSHSSGG